MPYLDYKDKNFILEVSGQEKLKISLIDSAPIWIAYYMTINDINGPLIKNTAS